MMAAQRSGQIVHAGDGRRLTLGKHLKSGGAGSIYLLPQAPTEVAKLYHPGFDQPYARRKLAAMLGARPKLPDIVEGGQRYIQMAWPTTTLHEPNGQFSGFLMPAIDIAATSELELVLQDKQARAHGLPTGLGAKMTLAANLAAVIAELHAQHDYVVDLKPVNLRFYRQALFMALLDCDGLSVHTPQERFHATQFTPEYLAPEFQSGRVPSDGEELQDRFALAVIIFQLLSFGLHPFAGRPQGDHVPTDLPGRIAGRFYAYGLMPHQQIAPIPSSTHTLLPAELRQMFDLALGSRDGRVRPSAAQWASVLKDYARRSGGKLVVCARNAEHQHFAGLACAACARQGHIAQAGKSAKQRARPHRSPHPSATPSPGLAGLPPSAVPAAAVSTSGVGVWVIGLIIGAILLAFLVLGSTVMLTPKPSPVRSAEIQSSATRNVPSQPWGDDEWDAELLRAGKLALKGEELPFREQMGRLKAIAPTKISLSDAERTRYREALGIYNQFPRVKGYAGMEQRQQALQQAYDLNPYERGLASEHAFVSSMQLPPLRAQASKHPPQAPEVHAYTEAVAQVERAFARSVRGAYIDRGPLQGSWFGLAMLYFERGEYEAVKGALAVYYSLPSVSSDFEVSRLNFVRKTWLQRADHQNARWNILDAQAQVAAAMLRGSTVAQEVSELAAKPWPAPPPPEGQTPKPTRRRR